MPRPKIRITHCTRRSRPRSVTIWTMTTTMRAGTSTITSSRTRCGHLWLCVRGQGRHVEHAAEQEHQPEGRGHRAPAADAELHQDAHAEPGSGRGRGRGCATGRLAAAPLPSAFDLGANTAEPEEGDLADMAMEIDDGDDRTTEPASDLEELVVAGQSTVSLIPRPHGDAETVRSQSQQSSDSSSSQSQPGFFGQASRLVSSVLGGSKKAKPEPVKSLQLAAAAAKKQQRRSKRRLRA
ncbi:hypothetical protein B0H21DRAFT_37970 [Amylocystis lapponica]|nr:hypothetical protein B0H21DRAFT_37970 [Amylocystis lapponica]